MRFYFDIHRTKYLWNSVIFNSENNDEHVAYASFNNVYEAEAWGDGFLKGLNLKKILYENNFDRLRLNIHMAWSADNLPEIEKADIIAKMILNTPIKELELMKSSLVSFIIARNTK